VKLFVPIQQVSGSNLGSEVGTPNWLGAEYSSGFRDAPKADNLEVSYDIFLDNCLNMTICYHHLTHPKQHKMNH
jgi:hypothetical protein